MSVSSVSGSGQANIAQLQRQLQTDQKALLADQRANAKQQVQQLDAAKVQLDQSMISTVTQAQAQAAAQAAAQGTAANKASAPPAQAAASAAPKRQPNGSLYL
jgi:hypothetical protein